MTTSVLVRAPNWVGDVVLSLPALRDLRRAFPTARLEVLARPWVAELYRAVPEVDAVVESRGHAGRRRGPARPPRPGRPASELLRHCARPLARGDPRALGLCDRRPRRAADAELPRAGRRPGPQPGVLLSGHAGRPGTRGRGAARRVARVPRGVGGAGPGPARGRRALDRRQSRRLLRHGQALAARALRRRRRPRGPPHRGERRDRGRRRGAAARRGRRRAAQSALARPVRRDDARRARRRPEAPAGAADERLGPHAPRRRARHPARGGLRLDRLDRDLARLRPRARRARGDGVRAVPPAGVPDRPPLHDPRRRPSRGRRRAGAVAS